MATTHDLPGDRATLTRHALRQAMQRAQRQVRRARCPHCGSLGVLARGGVDGCCGLRCTGPLKCATRSSSETPLPSSPNSRTIPSSAALHHHPTSGFGTMESKVRLGLRRTTDRTSTGLRLCFERSVVYFVRTERCGSILVTATHMTASGVGRRVVGTRASFTAAQTPVELSMTRA